MLKNYLLHEYRQEGNFGNIHHNSSVFKGHNVPIFLASNNWLICSFLFLHLMQVTQADVKFFFETVCGEVCSVPCLMNLKLFIVLQFLSITYWTLFPCIGSSLEATW